MNMFLCEQHDRRYQSQKDRRNTLAAFADVWISFLRLVILQSASAIFSLIETLKMTFAGFVCVVLHYSAVISCML
jgi:hypothetical protein